MSGITVVSTVLNAVDCVARHVRSVDRQTLRPGAHILIDAGSSDGTIREARVAGSGECARLVIYHSELPLLQNLANAVRKLPPNEIVVHLDGDDWLTHEYAFERVHYEYEQGAWMTFGQFEWPDGRRGFAAQYPSHVIERRAYRQWAWLATHLKTFRAGLFQQLTDADLQMASGRWIDLAVDQAVMLPMLEMANGNHRFIPEVLHHYNYDHALMMQDPSKLALERAMVNMIREREVKAPLTVRPW